MVFTNITSAGIYMQCCHREVEPGGSFTLPWLEARDNRGLRMAMSGGAFVWESEKDEPTVPGSPDAVWEARKKAKAAAASRSKAAAAKREERVAAARKADDEAVSRNMAGMGRFKVPQVSEYKVQARKVKAEKPITKDDVISGGAPKSLADIRRHNKAVRQAAK